MDDFSLVDFEFIRYAWLFCLGIAGFLDILATILPPYFYSNPEISDANLSGIENYEQNEHILVFGHWLMNNHITINLFFSALWFIDAFVDANARQNKVLRKQERRRLRVCKEEEPKHTYFWQTAKFVYYSTIIFQLVLLPVGFYFTVYYLFNNRVVHGKAVENLNDVHEELVVVTSDKEGFAYSEERFSVNTKLTLLFAIIQHLWVTASGTTARLAKAKITAIARRMGPTAIRKLMGSAIKHPISFRRRMKKILTAVRWFKYLAPICGTFNKLKSNVEDIMMKNDIMMKKHKQRREAKKQKKARKMLWMKKTPEMREEDAAIIVQSTWRSCRARKATTALQLIQGNKEYFATLKVQRVMRRRLARARERLDRKRAELERLEMLRKRNASRLSDDEKKHMYELQDELGKEAKELFNRKLLLRPNTIFAVVWKILFAVCVSMEIIHLVLQPMLVQEVHKKGAEPFTMENLAAELFVPTKISEWPTCQHKKRNHHFEEEPLPWYCQGAAAMVHGGVRDLVALALIPAPVTEWENCQKKEPSLIDRVLRRKNESPHDWYCEKPYSAAHGIYRKMVAFFRDEFMLLVSIVCFLDVFVTFFTGNLDPETGSIVPKPFVARWLVPGLLLQLLVNPNMDYLSQFLGQVLEKAFELGPIRVFRWCIAVFFPLIYVSYHSIIEHIWLPVVKFENVYRTF